MKNFQKRAFLAKGMTFEKIGKVQIWSKLKMELICKIKTVNFLIETEVWILASFNFRGLKMDEGVVEIGWVTNLAFSFAKRTSIRSFKFLSFLTRPESCHEGFVTAWRRDGVPALKSDGNSRLALRAARLKSDGSDTQTQRGRKICSSLRNMLRYLLTGTDCIRKKRQIKQKLNGDNLKVDLLRSSFNGRNCHRSHTFPK